MTDQGASNRDAETYAIIGAVMEAHGQLGHGFLEAVYQGALAAERGIGFERELEIPIMYKGARLASSYPFAARSLLNSRHWER